jgi:hypothetical protein
MSKDEAIHTPQNERIRLSWGENFTNEDLIKEIKKITLSVRPNQ